MRKAILISLVMIPLALILTLSALAQPPRKEGLRMMLKEELNLSEKQMEKIKDINLNFQREAIRLRADLKIARMEMHQMMQEPDAPKGEIFRKVDEISAIQNRLKKNQVERKLALREVLSPEQFEKFQELKRDHLKKGIKEKVKKRIILGSDGLTEERMELREDCPLGPGVGPFGDFPEDEDF